MAITGKKIITLEEFKASEIYDTTLAVENNIQYNDHYLIEAISIASINIDYLTSFKLFTMMTNNEIGEEDLNDIKFACCKYVLHLIRKGLEYARGQDSSSIGSISWSTTNPDDPFYIIPDVKIVLERLNLLNNFYIGHMKTPTDESQGRLWNYDIDGKGPLNIRKADSLYVGWEKIDSEDKSLIINVSTDTIFNKKMNIEVNVNSIVSRLYTNAVFIETIRQVIGNRIYDISEEVVKEVLKESTIYETLVNQLGTLIEDDSTFKEIVEVAVNRMLSEDEIFITNVAANSELQEKLTNNIIGNDTLMQDFENKVSTFLSSDDTFITNIANNDNLINKLIDNLIQKLTDLLNSTYSSLIKTIQIDTLDNKSVNDAINEKWIVGEIKAMHISITTMPTGWKRLSFNEGATLVNYIDGSSTGTASLGWSDSSVAKTFKSTDGLIKSHTHTATQPAHTHTGSLQIMGTDRSKAWSGVSRSVAYYDYWKTASTTDMTMVYSDWAKENYGTTSKRYNTGSSTPAITVSSTGSGRNYAFGYGVAYWMYDPNDEIIKAD